MRYDSIVKKLKEAGFTITTGGRHHAIRFPCGKFCAPLPNHKEICLGTVKSIEKKTGVKLL